MYFVNAHAQQPSVTKSPSVINAPIPPAQLLQPAELTQMLHASGSDKPLVLQVGSHVLYAEAHIPGSEYVGAAGQNSGLKALRERVNHVKKDQLLVIYCGCCPWDRCPNIRPAFQQLRTLGFTRLKVLYLAENFGTDWVDKGYPISSGR